MTVYIIIKCFNLPLDWTRAVALVTCSYLMTQLHVRTSKPSSATEVAMMILWLPSLNAFSTSSCLTCVWPAVIQWTQQIE